MADDITLPGTGTKVETKEQPDGSHRQVVDTQGELLEALRAIQIAMNALLRTIGASMPDANGRVRVTLDAQTIASLTVGIAAAQTLATVTTVTNLAQMGGFSANDQVPALMRIAAQQLRGNVLVS